MRALRFVGVGCAAATTLAGASVFASAPPDEPTTTVSYPTVAPFTIPPTTTTTTVAPTTVAGQTLPAATTTTSTVPIAQSPAAQAPPVTLVPLGPAEQAVVDALYEARVVFVEAVLDPDAPGLDDRLAATYGEVGQARRIVEEYRAELRESGLRGRLSTDALWRLVVEEVVFYEQPFPNADVTACWVDPLPLVEPGGAPDGADVVVNDDLHESRILFTLVPAAGRWQLRIADSLSEIYVNAELCELG